MHKPSIGLSLEGLPFIFLTTVATLTFAVLGCWFMATLLLVALFFVLNFFRDPERVIPQEPGLAVSPADGKVIKVQTMRDPLTGEDRTAICVFMNVFNVHVNRYPVSGTVKYVHYNPGKFLNAAVEKSSLENEQMSVGLDHGGVRILVRQIAGLIARRIVTYSREGESVSQGDRMGIIRFGSRVDVFLPPGTPVAVKVGQTTFAGTTLLARLGGR